MKNIAKIFISCLALAVGLSGCYDEMDDKAVVDANHTKTCDATISLNEASVVSFSELAVSGAVSDLEGVMEVGFMISTTEDFLDSDTYPMSEMTTSFSLPITGLDEQTTYYVRSYAYTIAGLKISDVMSVTTPVAPIFEVDGVYTAIEYSTEDNSAGAPYNVLVEFEEGSTTNLLITNLWGGGMTVKATFDAASGKVTIPAKQIIYVDSQYGNVWMEDGNDAKAILGQFTPKGGFLNINAFYAICSAGSFGGQSIKMSHK